MVGVDEFRRDAKNFLPFWEIDSSMDSDREKSMQGARQSKAGERPGMAPAPGRRAGGRMGVWAQALCPPRWGFAYCP